MVRTVWSFNAQKEATKGNCVSSQSAGRSWLLWVARGSHGHLLESSESGVELQSVCQGLGSSYPDVISS